MGSSNRKLEEGIYKISWLFTETLVGNLNHMKSQLNYYKEKKRVTLDQLISSYIGRYILARHLERISFFAFAHDNKVYNSLTKRHLMLRDGILTIVSDLKMNKSSELEKFQYIKDFVKEILNCRERRVAWDLIKKVVVEHYSWNHVEEIRLWRHLGVGEVGDINKGLQGVDLKKPKIKRKRWQKRLKESYQEIDMGLKEEEYDSRFIRYINGESLPHGDFIENSDIYIVDTGDNGIAETSEGVRVSNSSRNKYLVNQGSSRRVGISANEPGPSKSSTDLLQTTSPATLPPKSPFRSPASPPLANAPPLSAPVRSPARISINPPLHPNSNPSTAYIPRHSSTLESEYNPNLDEVAEVINQINDEINHRHQPLPLAITADSSLTRSISTTSSISLSRLRHKKKKKGK